MLDLIEKIGTAVEDYGTWFLVVFLAGVAIGSGIVAYFWVL